MRLGFTTLVVIVVTFSWYCIDSLSQTQSSLLPVSILSDHPEPTAHPGSPTPPTLSTSSETTVVSESSPAMTQTSAVSTGASTAMNSESDEPWAFEEDFETTLFTGDPEVDYPPFPLHRNGSLGYSVFTETCRIPKYEIDTGSGRENRTPTESAEAVGSCGSGSDPFVIGTSRRNDKVCFEFDEDVIRTSYPHLPLERWNCSYTTVSGTADPGSFRTKEEMSFQPGDCIEGRMLRVTCSISSPRLEYRQILVSPTAPDQAELLRSAPEIKSSPNVILIELETLSRADVHNHLRRFIKHLDAVGNLVEIQGYNTMGNAAEENRHLFLTGTTLKGAAYDDIDDGSVGRAAYIWEDFERNGFKVLIYSGEKSFDGTGSTFSSDLPTGLPVEVSSASANVRISQYKSNGP